MNGFFLFFFSSELIVNRILLFTISHISEISINLLTFRRIKAGRDENVSTLQYHEL